MMTAHDTKTMVAALTEEHVSRITGLTKGQLRAWDRRGFFVPRYAYSDRSSAYSRIYSFKDAVGLKTIAVLRYEHKISLQRLTEVAKKLEARGFSHWADTKLYVVKKEVYFKHPESERVESLKDGQYAMLHVINVINDVQEKVIELKKRNSSQVGKIERNKYVARNSWVVAGTRIPTATIQRYAEAGFTVAQIMKEYPTLSANDVRAAINHEKGLAKSA